MSKPAKIFFIGVVISLAVLAVGHLLDRREQSALDSLVVKCKSVVREASDGPLQETHHYPPPATLPKSVLLLATS